jgi:ubiquinone biosynthesis accessory factor UbiK
MILSDVRNLMIDPKIIDDIASKLSQAVPEGAKSFQQDMHVQFKQILQSIIGKMDLVSREEFDVQTKVLARTREKIDALEKAIAALEDQQRQGDTD